MNKEIEKIRDRVMLNLKGSKRGKHWLSGKYPISNDLKTLYDQLGTIRRVANEVGVSHDVVGKALNLLKLTPEVQEMIKNNQIGQDVGGRIAGIKDKKLQIKVAHLVADLDPSTQARELIQYAKKYPNANIDEFKKLQLGNKPSIEKLFITAIPLDAETFNELKRLSRRQKKSIEEVILKMIKSSLSRGGRV